MQKGDSMIIYSTEKFVEYNKKYGITFSKKQLKAHEKAFKQGGFLFTPNEIKKQRWIIKPDVIIFLNDMIKKEKNVLLTDRTVLGWYGIGKSVYVYHWSQDNSKSPFDIVLKMKDWSIAIDVKTANATRICMQPRWGSQPKLKEKIRNARKNGLIPALAFIDPEKIEEYSHSHEEKHSIRDWYIYPLTEDGYIANLNSDPYLPKLKKLSSKFNDIPIFKSLGCYEQYKEGLQAASNGSLAILKKYGITPIEKKPMIIHLEDWRM